MALYRQIAGHLDGDPERVGLFASTYFQGAGILPVGPNTPAINVSDTGGVSPYDPKANFDPDSVNIDTIPTPIPLPEGVNPLPPITPSQPLTPTTEVLPADTKTAINNNILPLLALAAVMVVAVKGDDLLHGNRKIAMLGGLGLLYYGMAKNKLV